MNEAVTTLKMPIATVTVMEDRARIVRRGTVTGLSKEDVASFVVDGIAPVAVDKTLTARIVEGQGEIVDVHISRWMAAEVADADAAEGSLAQLKSESDSLDRRLSELLDFKAALDRKASALDKVAGLSLAEIAEDASWGRGEDDQWRERARQLQKQERSIRAEIFESDQRLRELYAAQERLEARMAVIRDPSSREAARLEIALRSDGEELGLEVEYTVSNVCWRPCHVATLKRAESERIEFRTDAYVWQNTGVSWTDVELAFSTERASLGTRPPDLDSDILSVRRKSSQVVVEAREEEIYTTGLGASASAAAELPGVDDGGDVVLLHSRESASIASDGRAHAVLLDSFEAEATTRLVAVPELSSSVFLKSLQTNEAKAPILAGPVDLIRDSGLVGRATVLFVAPGERFEIGWGPEADLRIKRVSDAFREKTRMLSAWATRGYSVEVLISNLGEVDREVVVTERIPVSESEKVKIELDDAASSPDSKADEQGFVNWTVSIPALSTANRSLRYLLKRHEDVVGI